MEHNNLTIVAVYGHNDGMSAVPALQKSLAELPGSKGLLLSFVEPQRLPPNIQWKQIGRLDYMQYSTFVMHSLYAFIDTEFCLIVQDDGWVLNGANWKPEYYDYDYIGGITHGAVVGNELKLGYTWVEDPVRTLVLNGGLSLRSKRFLEAPNKFGIVHTPANEIHLWNEDVQLTAIKRRQFESRGIKFAPDEVCREFSIEYVGPKIHDDLDFTKLVGHHAPTRKLVMNNHIVVTHPKSVTQNYFREIEFLDYLQSIGYTVEYVAEPNQEGANAPAPAVH